MYHMIYERMIVIGAACKRQLESPIPSRSDISHYERAVNIAPIRCVVQREIGMSQHSRLDECSLSKI